MEMKMQRKIAKQDEANLIMNGFTKALGEAWVKHYSNYFCLILNPYSPNINASGDVLLDFSLEGLDDYFTQEVGFALIDESFNVGELFMDLMHLLESGLIKLED